MWGLASGKVQDQHEHLCTKPRAQPLLACLEHLRHPEAGPERIRFPPADSGLAGQRETDSLHLFPQWSFAVATITEIPPVIFLPNFLVQRKVLKPLRTQTGGTIMVGGELAEGAVAGLGPPTWTPSYPGPLPTPALHGMPSSH